MSKNQDKRTATQRIEDLERAVSSLYYTLDQMARDLNTMREAIKLLGNKSDAIVKTIQRGLEMNDDNVGKIMMENNVEELKEKVANYVKQGVLTPSETINENSFVVGRDVTAEGEVVNPRIQFAFNGADLSPETKEVLKGKKAGDVLDFGPEKAKFEVLEVYHIGAPEVSAEEAPAAEQTSEAAPEASTEQAPASSESSEVASS